MVDPLSLFSIASGVAALWYVAARERRALQGARTKLLDGCVSLVAGAKLSHQHDGFPRLKGMWRGGPVILSLFPDTLTPRRLPQLWLAMTRPPVGTDVPLLDILVRPTGTEAYAFDAAGLDRFDVPSGLPGEALIRGEGARARRLLGDLAGPLADLLSDPRVKEVTFTPRATRIIWQAAEGHRGNHLILRQATFENAGVAPAAVLTLLDHIERLRMAHQHTQTLAPDVAEECAA